MKSKYKHNLLCFLQPQKISAENTLYKATQKKVKDLAVTLGKTEGFGVQCLEFTLQFLSWKNHQVCGTVHSFNRFEQNNGLLAQVEVNEVSGFMCHVTTELPPQDTVSGEEYFLSNPFLIWTAVSFSIFLHHPCSTLHQVYCISSNLLILKKKQHLCVLYWNIAD